MGNCLVTKLKGSVDNPNLEYFGGIKIHVFPVEEPSEGSRVIGAFGWKEALILGGSAYFTNREGTANYGQHITSDMHSELGGEWTNYIRVSNDTADVVIMSKYNIYGFICPPTGFPKGNIFGRRYIEGDTMKYIGANVPEQMSAPGELASVLCTNYAFYELLPASFAATITKVNFRYGNDAYSPTDPNKGKYDDYIDVDCIKSSYFKNFSGLKELALSKFLNIRSYQSKLTGPQINLNDFAANNPLLELLDLDQMVFDSAANIAQVGSLIHLTTLCLLPLDSNNNPVRGTVEAFVQAQRAAGRTTNADGIFVPFIGWWGCTFNGQAITRVPAPSHAIAKLTWTASTITLVNGSETTTVDA